MVETARVVIIGGGAVGASALYHLALKGWTDCLLLERNELTAGSTWHAAGNVPTFSSSWSIMNMQRYSAGLYRGLGEAVNYPMNYHVTGSVRLGHTDERLREFHKVVGMGRYQGMDLAILTPGEIRAKYPFVETHDLTGALYDPYDGDIDPAQLTQALAAGARQLGARIERFRPVTGARREGGEWVLETPKGEVRCDYVVNAGGYYAGRVGALFGRRVPMMVMSHQYLLFDTIPELEQWTRESGHKLPLLRDVDSSYYLRQEKMGFNLGPYENPCRAHWTTPDDPMPEDFSFQLYPDDLERLEWHINDAMARVPLLEKANLQKVINGPIPYTPDGNPLIGPMPGVPNAFEACVFTFGICQAGGAGKVLAEWVTEGGTEWDMWSCDPRRFTGWEDPAYCVAKGLEVYGHEYAIHFPMARWPAAPDRKLSPVHDRLKALGAQFAPYNGWERAEYYARPGDDTSWEATQTYRRNGPWEPRIRAECEAVRDGCGVLDLPGFTRLRVTGPGARNHVAGLIAGRMPAEGRIGLAYFPDHRGRILTEMTLMNEGPDAVGLITAAVAQLHDRAVLERGLPEGCRVEDWSDAVHCFILTGPTSRALLAPLTDADLTLPWLSVQSATVAGRPCALVRVSFAGELGWELHMGREDAPPILDAILAAGATPFGMKALNALRIEKGYRAWKGDLSTDYTLLQGGLDRFIDWSRDFPGKAPLEAERQQGPAKRLTLLTVDAPDFDPPYMANVWSGDAIVGEVTSAAWGYRVGACVALATIRTDLTAPGTALEVEIFGNRHKATAQGQAPLWDAGNERLAHDHHLAPNTRRGGRGVANPPGPPPMTTITLLDGGMGQELIHRAGDRPTPLWATQVMIDHPGLVQAVHDDYFAAGASLATTNTYAIHHDRFVKFGLDHRFREFYDAALAEAEAARAKAGHGLIAGSMGPLVASYRPETLPPHPEAVAKYAEVAAILAPRVDLLIGETVASVAHARALVEGAKQGAPGKVLWLSMTVEDRDGTLLRSGEKLAEIAPLAAQVDAVLCNCSAPEAMDQAMPVLATFGKPFGAYANGFQQITSDFLKDNPTVDALSARPEMTPARYADFALGWVAQGATLVGGCCETGPAHIAELARRLRAAGHQIA